MAASEAAVTAVMETLGCRRSKTHRMIGGGRESWCVMHNWSTWTDRCPVAVAAADAAWAAFEDER